MGDDRIKWIANEGVRISRVIKDLRAKLVNPAHVALFETVVGSEAQSLVMPTSGAGVSAAGDSGPSMVSRDDGSAVWTIPLTVTVNVGGGAAPPLPRAAAIPPSNVVALPPPSPPPQQGGGRNPTEILASAKTALRQNRANVMGVRLGYVFKDGRITQERALVVTVREKKSVAELNAAKIEELPTTFEGLKVQVTEPTIPELILAEKGFAASESLGLNIDALTSEITYKPPASAGLKPVKARMRVIAHVSPDAGWGQAQQLPCRHQDEPHGRDV